MSTWYLLIGLLLLLMVMIDSRLKRLPLSSSIFYLAVGAVMGPWCLSLIQVELIRDARGIESVSEAAVLISLFTAGLKLRAPLRERLWRVPLILATATMIVTTLLLALVARALLDVPWGAAILLGAILSPTDPVLASDVQTGHPADREPLRFSLTGEAGLNDGTAFPLVMLGLGLLHLHELGGHGLKWVLVDVLWATAGGIAIGWLLGNAIARCILYLRRHHREALGFDDFLALGLVAASYGIALKLHAYGFLAVFAAGLSLRRIEKIESDQERQKALPVSEDEAAAVNRESASAEMAREVLNFNQQLERLGEVALVLLLGALLAKADFTAASWSLAVLVLIAIRPAAVFLTMLFTPSPTLRTGFIAWFGIRGVGSLYYFSYVVNAGLPEALARPLASAVLATIVLSLILHGVSVTPLMNLYETWRRAIASSVKLRKRAAR